MNTKLIMRARQSIAVFLMLLISVSVVSGQQATVGSDINRIRAEIEKRQAVDQTAGIPETARAENRRILRIRQAQLGYLLEAEGLQKYKSMLGESMLPAEKAKIEADLKDLQSKFDALARNLTDSSSPPADLTGMGSAGVDGAAHQNPRMSSDEASGGRVDADSRRQLLAGGNAGGNPSMGPPLTGTTQQVCPDPLTAGFTPAKRFEVDSLYAVVLPPTMIGNLSADQYIVRVFVSDRMTPLPNELMPSNFTITYLPSGRKVPVGAIGSPIEVEAGSNCRALIIPIDFNYTDQARKDAAGNLIQGLSRPASDDKQVKVEISRLTFDGKAASNLSKTGKFYNSINFAELADKEIQTVSAKSAAVSKTSQERNIFAGVNVDIPSGAGSTEGSGEINFNRTLFSPRLGEAKLFDRINFGLQLKKGSEERSDPRHLSLGFNFRKTFLRLNRQNLEAIKSALFADPGTLSAATQADALTAVGNIQKDFIRAYLWDTAFRFEGDVSGTSFGNVSNLVLDSQLQIATVTKAFAADTGFLNLRFIPVGVEVGYNMRNEDNPAVDKNSLARVKTGGIATLFYEARDPDDFLNRIEFETQGVARYLFRRESAFDEATKKAIFTDRGLKYWLQSDLKFLLGPRIGKGRAGFRLSFSRGSLPPVYAYTKAFKFGLVFETTDDTTADEIKK